MLIQEASLCTTLCSSPTPTQGSGAVRRCTSSRGEHRLGRPKCQTGPLQPGHTRLLWLSQAFAPGHKHVCPPDPPQGTSPKANPGSGPEGLVGWCLRSTLLLGECSMRSQRPCSRCCSLLVRANDRWVSKSQDVASRVCAANQGKRPSGRPPSESQGQGLCLAGRSLRAHGHLRRVLVWEPSPAFTRQALAMSPGKENTRGSGGSDPRPGALPTGAVGGHLWKAKRLGLQTWASRWMWGQAFS